MRKKRAASRRRTVPDPKYNDVLVSEFINNIMKQGKKHRARRILYDAFALIEERTKKTGLDVFKKAVSNTRPVLEVKARRVGGATYQVPTEVRGGPERCAGDPLAHRLRERPERQVDVAEARRRIHRRVATAKETRSRKRKIRTRWPKPTRPSPISSGDGERK